MKIDKVIFTIDDNPHYKGFWSSISKHYNTKLKIRPKLFVISSKIGLNEYDETNGDVEFVDAIPNIPTIIQALIGKFYFTNTEPKTVWLIGDLDLYPMQHFHFKGRISDISDDMYVHLNPHAYGVDWRYRINGLAGYFHVAKGQTFSEELSFTNKTFFDVVNEIYTGDRWGIKFHGLPASVESKEANSEYGWFCCEEMYTGELLRDSRKLIEVTPINGAYNRIDRSNIIYEPEKIKNGYYIDFHSVRPYEKFNDLIETIISNVPVYE